MRKNKSFLKIMLFLVPQAHISVCTSHISVWTSNRLLNITSQQLHFWSFPKKPAPQREILCVLAPFPNTVPLTQRWANATFVHHEHNIITCHEARVFNGKKKKSPKGGEGLNHLMRLPTAALLWNTSFRGLGMEGSRLCNRKKMFLESEVTQTPLPILTTLTHKEILLCSAPGINHS